VFGATFLALTLGGKWAVQHVDALAYARDAASVVHYPDSSWYVAFDGGPQLDHYVLYYGLGQSIAHARAADILILGNSRVQFGFPDRVLRAFEARHGVSIFSMGFGFVEAHPFPLAIIRKFDLRPKLVLVNADGFFTDRESGFARAVRATGWWNAAKQVWEADASARALPVLTRVFPSLVARHAHPYLLRSSTTGAWLPMEWAHNDRPYVPSPFKEGIEPLLPAARRFQEEMRERGAAMVLTCVPAMYEWCTPTFVRALAARLGVPALLPRVEGLKLGDKSHLCPVSARRFSRAVLKELAATEEFRRLARR
jgi:hypothetical protein